MKLSGRRIAKAIIKIYYFLLHRIRWPRVKMYGASNSPSYFSQYGQEKAILDSLEGQVLDNAIFVDVGCNHPITYSNTYFFEREFGVRTLAIDPLPDNDTLWTELRPNATKLTLALGAAEQDAWLIVPQEIADGHVANMFSSVGRAPKAGSNLTRLEVKIRRLSDILDERGISEVVCCSIDVEGGELEVLKGIDFERHKIQCFCIENNANNPYGDDDLRQFLCAKGYRYIARVGTLDDIFILQMTT